MPLMPDFDPEPDEGCRYFAKCVECPLIDCYLSYVDEERGRNEYGISKAIAHTWERGGRHPLFSVYYSGSPDAIPRDVIAELAKPVEWCDGALTNAALDYCVQLREKGYSWDVLARVFSRSNHALRQSVYRSGRGPKNG